MRCSHRPTELSCLLGTIAKLFDDERKKEKEKKIADSWKKRRT
jgi:hypothetical protein